MNKSNDSIDAVKMVRAIRDKQYKELAGKSKKEQQEYYRLNSEWAFNKATKKKVIKK
jgi:hypothetical protein